MKQQGAARRMVLVLMLIYLTLLGGTVFSFDRADFPAPTAESLLGGSYAQELEAYLQEHLGFHDVLFRIKSRTDMFVGEKMIRGVYVTEDMLLEKLTSEERMTDAEAAAPVNDFYEAAGVPTYLILVPSASEIYRTSLPANAVNAEQKSRISRIYAETAQGVRCIDAYNVLSALKSNYIYYRTDTHWTSYGAFAVYQSAVQKMGFTAVPYQRYVISHISTGFRGDLYAKTLYGGVKDDVLDWYSNESGGSITGITAYHADGTAEERGTRLYDRAALGTEDMYRFYLGEPCERLVIRTNLENGKHLLLLCDDFADCMVPFLTQHYSRITVVRLDGRSPALYAEDGEAAYTQALFLCSMKQWETLWE